jgi:hypothetical protein
MLMVVITILEGYNVSRNTRGIASELYSSTKQHKNLHQKLVNSTNCQYCQLALPMQLHQIRANLFTSHKSHMLNSWLNSMHIRVVLNDNDMTDKRIFNTSKDV